MQVLVAILEGLCLGQLQMGNACMLPSTKGPTRKFFPAKSPPLEAPFPPPPLSRHMSFTLHLKPEFVCIPDSVS